MGHEIRPADVYIMVAWNFWLIGLLCVLVLAQVMVGVLMLRRQMKLNAKTDSVLNLMEFHGGLTDVQRERMAEIGKEIRADSKAAAVQAAKAAVQAALTTKHAISQIPERTAEKVVEKIKGHGNGGGGSGVNIGKSSEPPEPPEGGTST